MTSTPQSDWRIAGSYLESCNCEAICPCRRIDSVRGGRSTYGLCQGALSWRVEAGHADGVDLAGLGVVLASRYHDDEQDSPWSFVLYVDERGDAAQRAALEAIFTGQWRGSQVDHFPWVWKPSHLIAVRPAAIEIEHVPGRGFFRVGSYVELRVARPVDGGQVVSCVIPGHARSGRELYAERLEVRDGELQFEFRGRCAYESSFEYHAAMAAQSPRSA